MSWLVRAPGNAWEPEKRYVAEVVFGEFLGLPHRFEMAGDARDWELRFEDRTLATWPNLFFPEMEAETYLTAMCLPAAPRWLELVGRIGLAGALAETRLPVFWGRPELHGPEDIDLFGTIFFFLARIEELVSKERDEHDRFAARHSTLGRSGLLERPIVDECVEILWQTLKRNLPAAERAPPVGKIWLSHDVDVPYRWRRRNGAEFVRKLGGDLLKRRSPQQAAISARSFLQPESDPLWTFDWLMDTAERAGLSSTFFFLVGGNHHFDTGYDPAAPEFRRLFAEIDRRGHEIGLHSSYETYRDLAFYAREVATLRGLSPQPVRGVRQHFLRFAVPDTLRQAGDAGMRYDSSLGFADHAGFRCGTGREYPVFDARIRKKLPLRERPLVLMEHSLFAAGYQSLEPDAAFAYAHNLKRRALRFGGTFSLLWHNNNLGHPWQRELLVSLLEKA